ncbi:hypothetical protein [Moritella sp. F3]|uniref:hypothetical protein n=1 Tax=Moritella sp. F3 TaxID=2718882 RepID=UPI0018E14EE0|nr:hypothetical protein [Moritella sp. F3]GIC77089.1 hypothetical protein FMO001_18160 [Moritella sp. F1]GIC82208.1 hypothetical protein FMO003_24890 [Moritella sp. F3]
MTNSTPAKIATTSPTATNATKNTLAKTDNFIVKDGFGDSGRLHVTVKGMGVVTINRTHEGLIVDVNRYGDDDTIGSLCFDSSDFSERYIEELESMIKSFDKNIDVSVSFLDLAWEKGLELTSAVQKYFSDCCFDVLTLKGLKGNRSDYQGDVANLKRPYIAITPEANSDLTNGKYDYYQTNTGKVVTFGDGLVLIPLKDMFAIEILANQ